MTTMIKRAVNKIVRDLSDRKGLGDELDNIDSDIKKEIKQSWISIIEAELAPSKG